MNSQSLIEELQYKTSRSSGPGGQHANKTESRVTVFFSIPTSQALSPEEKKLVLHHLKSYLTQDGTIQLSSETSRSQHQNKDIVTQRLLRLIETALIPQKKRVKTKPSRQAHKKRLEKKKRQALKKASRKKPDF